MNKKLNNGDKYNRLTIIKHLGGKNGYLCRCECGNETIARGYCLTSGRHASCGCLAKEKLAQRNYKDNFQALKNEIYKNYKKSAEKRNHNFNLTIDEFNLLISGNCHYCGIEPITSWFGTKRKIIDTSNFKYNGVDRVINEVGYNLDNCVSCCKFCNNAKNTLSKSDFLQWVNRVYEYQTKKFND
jgi:hypothetical protein